MEVSVKNKTRQIIAYHDAANLFPIDEDNIDALAEDIQAFGLKHPIELYEGKIIDGRRRFKACLLAGVDPKMITVNPDDPISYVLSLNLHRRHLTISQRAMVVARCIDLYNKAAKERQKRKPADFVVENLPPQKARDAAGKAAKVSGKTVDHAKKVLNKGEPELIKAVDEGRMAVSTAAVLAEKTREEQMEEVNKPKRNKVYSASPTKGRGEKTTKPGTSRGVGIERAHEAIACLKRIPKSDKLRKRGFQIVSEWIRFNK